MSKEITLKNVLSFIEGNIKFQLDKLDVLPKYYKEQVVWRMSFCKDSCLIEGKCEYCGCDAEKKLYVEESCNKGEKFPDLMTKEEWEEYKKENNIDGEVLIKAVFKYYEEACIE